MNTLQLFQWVVIESARYYDVRVNFIYEKERMTEVCRARWLAMLTSYAHLNLNANQIARLLHRNHTTILYGLERAKSLPEIVTATETVWAVVESKKNQVIPQT